MSDGDGGANGRAVTRRRLLRGAGLAAGGLTASAATGTAGALAGGPIDAGGERLPFDGESVGESHPACEEPRPAADASDPNERYLQLVARQMELRDTYRPNMDTEAVRSILRDRRDEFDGHLVFFAASDFGQPRVFLPEDVSDRQACLQTVLDRIHEQKWRARHSGLRNVRNQMLDEVRGIHQGLGAVYHDGGSANYDIEFPWNRVYNFMTIRQAVGLVDWVTNAQEPWLDGLRLTY
jgi:hypothetical protein